MNIEQQTLTVALGHERLSPVSKSRQCLIAADLGFGQVGAGVQFIEQPASEYDDVDEWCLTLVGRTGLDRGEPIGADVVGRGATPTRSEEHTSELQSRGHLVCRLLLE